MVKHASALNAPPPPPPPDTTAVLSSSTASPPSPVAAKQQPQPATTTGTRSASPQQLKLKLQRSWLDWARGGDKKPVAGQPVTGQPVSFTERYFGADGKVCAWRYAAAGWCVSR